MQSFPLAKANGNEAKANGNAVKANGVWFFISFVTIIGGIWLLILLLTESTPGGNMYGASPKAAVEAA